MQDKNGDVRHINRFTKKRFALLLVIAVALLANLLLDPGLYRSYESPIACSGNQRIHLVFGKKYPFQKESLFIYSSKRPDGEWSEHKEFAGNPLAVACFNSQLVIFYESSCSIYEEGKRKGNVSWDCEWRVSDAVQCGDSLFAFGSGGGDSSEYESFISAARYDGKRWTPLDYSPRIEGAISDLQAVSVGNLIALFWYSRDKNSRHKKGDKRLRYILFDPNDPAQSNSCWSTSRELSGLTGQTDRFAACGSERSVWIFCSAKSRELRLVRVDLSALTSGGKVTHSYKPKRKRVGSIASCQLRGRVHLFVSNGSIEEAVLSTDEGEADLTWPHFEDIIEINIIRKIRKIAWITSAAFALIVLTTASIAILRDTDTEQPPVRDEQRAQIELAPIGRRVLAYCFDAFALLPAILAVGFILASEYIASGGGSGSASLASEDLTLSASIAAAILSFLYFTICEGKWGQTLGKKMFGIAVAREDGKDLRFRDAVVRNLLRVVDEGFFMIGLLFILNTRKYQRIGDLVARTVVVKREIKTDGFHRRTD